MSPLDTLCGSRVATVLAARARRGNHSVMATPFPPQHGPEGRGEEIGDPVERGRLLVATPMMGDPNFDRTVVVVLEHDEDGTLGLVLNRPTAVPVAEVVAPWAAVAEHAPPAVVFAGGPVSPQVAVGLARMPVGTVSSVTSVVGDVQVVDLSTAPPGSGAGGLPGSGAGAQPGDGGGDRPGEPASVGHDPADTAVRVFAGYAGWGPGQLHDELTAGAWFVVDAWAEDIIGKDPEGLWRRVLRRQPGSLRLLATFPADPADN